MPSVAENAKKRCMYMNVFAWKAQTLHIYINLLQDKTQPFISDGFEVQAIHSQPV